MKIEATVVEVGAEGERLAIVMQGKEPGAAEWREPERQRITIVGTPTNKRAFYVGWRVEITVRPR